MRKWILILMIAVLLCGCSRDTDEHTAVVFEEASRFPTETIEELPLLNMGGECAAGSYEELYTDFGKFHSVQSEPEDNGPYLLTFSDFEAGKTYPLCPRSNCLHDAEDCGAYFPFSGGKADHLHYDGEYLYYFYRGNQTLYRQNIDGSERTSVADLSEAVFAVNTILYEEESAWILCERMTMNEDKTDYTIRKTILSVDLATGDWSELPYSFAGDMTNVELYGKYGDELLMRYSYSTGLIPFQNPEETKNIVFLFNTLTGEITRLTEYEYTYVSSAKCPGYLVYCIFDPASEYEVSCRGESWSAFSGEICIFDLEKRVCYRMESDCLTWEFSIRDGKLFYCEPGEDGVTLEGKIRDLETGEVTDWLFFDAEPQLRWLAETETGDHFIVMEGEQIYRITKEDYYAGNRNLIPIP